MTTEQGTSLEDRVYYPAVPDSPVGSESSERHVQDNSAESREQRSMTSRPSSSPEQVQPRGQDAAGTPNRIPTGVEEPQTEPPPPVSPPPRPESTRPESISNSGVSWTNVTLGSSQFESAQGAPPWQPSLRREQVQPSGTTAEVEPGNTGQEEQFDVRLLHRDLRSLLLLNQQMKAHQEAMQGDMDRLQSQIFSLESEKEALTSQAEQATRRALETDEQRVQDKRQHMDLLQTLHEKVQDLEKNKETKKESTFSTYEKESSP